MRWQIICDFDGTIAEEDAVVRIIDRFAPGGWETIRHRLNSGEMEHRDFMAELTGMMRASQQEWDALLDTLDIDPDFAGFLAETNRLGLPLTIASDGYAYSIKRILDRYGIHDIEIVSNHLVFEADKRLRLEFPNGDKDCAVGNGTCKCAVMGRLRNRRSVMIGDGYSDFCVAGAADFVFAKGHLIDHCRTEGIPFRAFTGFSDLIPLLPLLSGDGEKLREQAEKAPV